MVEKSRKKMSENFDSATSRDLTAIGSYVKIPDFEELAQAIFLSDNSNPWPSHSEFFALSNELLLIEIGT